MHTGSLGRLNRAGEAGRSTAISEKLASLQDSCKEASVKLRTLKGAMGLQPVAPWLQHPKGEGGELVGLLQVSEGREGGVWEMQMHANRSKTMGY